MALKLCSHESACDLNINRMLAAHQEDDIIVDWK